MASNERAPRVDDPKGKGVDEELPYDDIENIKDVVRKAGFAVALIRQYPDLEKEFKRLGRLLAKGKITEAQLAQEFKDRIDETDFGQRPMSEIQADLARYRKNNADWVQRVDDLVADIRDQARSIYGSGIGTKETRQVAIDLIYSGDTSVTAIQRALRGYLDQKTDETGQVSGGALGASQDELLRWLSMNDVQIGANELQKYTRDIMTGAMDMNQIKQQIRDRVFSNKYAAFADRFQQGMDVTDVSLEYRNMVSRMLEVPETSVGLDNDLVRKAMEYVDPSTGKSRPLAGYEFERMIRESDDWQYTSNAKQDYARVGRSILKSFGFEV